ncbi:MAG: hypothetical protein FWE01_01055 [Firmicutes bacterium]|nr:hypothetical protein [Bacillota bacterium]
MTKSPKITLLRLHEIYIDLFKYYMYLFDGWKRFVPTPMIEAEMLEVKILLTKARKRTLFKLTHPFLGKFISRFYCIEEVYERMNEVDEQLKKAKNKLRIEREEAKKQREAGRKNTSEQAKLSPNKPSEILNAPSQRQALPPGQDQWDEEE